MGGPPRLPPKVLGRAVRPRCDSAPLEYDLCSQEEPGVGRSGAPGGSWGMSCLRWRR